MSKAHEVAEKTAPVVLELGADLSPALHAIEKAYRMIQRRYADAPDVTIVIKRDERAWGHTTVAKVWAPRGTEQADRFEIMISGENLRRGALAVAGTLLHEAAHARNLNQGILDTDVNGRHNRKFAERAQQHGLTVRERGWHGFAETELEDEGAQAWKQLVKTIEAGLLKSATTAQPHLGHLGLSGIPTKGGKPAGGEATGGATGVPTGPRRRGNRNLLKATCGCGHSIRVSRGVLDAAQPTCQVCEQVFATPE